MYSSSRSIFVIVVLGLVVAAGYYLAREGENEGGGPGDGQAPASTETTAGQSAVSSPGKKNRKLDAARLALIDRAFEAVSAMPINPHLKNRSRSQQEVVDLCFELDQPELALSYAERIDNWRRHAAFANYAFRCAERGKVKRAKDYLALAQKGAREMAQDEAEQDWRIDEVRARIAATYMLLDDRKSASYWAAGVAGLAAQAFVEINVRSMKAEDFELRLEEARLVFKNGDFDQMRVTFHGLAELYLRFHDDESRRAQIAAAMDEGCRKIPVLTSFEAFERLAGNAIETGNAADAERFIAKLQSFLDNSRWRPADRCAHAGRLALLRGLNGDESGALEQVEKNVSFYDANRDQIVNIDRAGALRPLAEACVSCGDPALAEKLYKRALEEGFVNPNSRPRSQDLCNTLLSMALRGYAPSANVIGLIEKIYDALGPPW